MPMFSQARKEVMYCSFDYAPAKEKIAPPPLGAPVDDKSYGFNDIEQHKFDWKGRVVRLEVTPKILESKQIGEDAYRAFLKDTATPDHYGIVEFPHDALVKLGFLKKIVSGAHAAEELEQMGAIGRTDGKPVSFYVEVIPIGEKPAARALAVGARLVRDPDGSVSYTWESDEKQTVKSPPAPAEPDASDGDLVHRGIEKAKNGDLDGAIADFDRAAELDPKNDAPYYNRAQAKRLKNDTAGAIADYTKAIELGSTNPAAYNNRGNARAENKDRDGAIADYTRAIELKPDYARAYYNRAVTKKDKGDAAGAAADFKRARQLDPQLVSEESSADSIDHGIAKGNEKESPASAGTVEDFFNRAGAKKAVGDLGGAIANYDRAIQLDPKDAAIYNNRGLAKQAKGDFNAAIADFNRAIELNPKDAVAYSNRGNARDEKGDLEGAIADYSRGIELNPKDSKAYDYRGEVHAKKKEYDAAVTDTLKAIELDPKNGDYYLSLSWYQLFNRKPREAIAASLKALELSPDDTVMIKTNLAHGYLFDNQFDKAKTIYLENKNAKVRDGKRTFSQAALDDFKEFQDAGITHPDMEKIKALLTAKAEAP